MLSDMDHDNKLFNRYSAWINIRRQNLTSVDVRF